MFQTLRTHCLDSNNSNTYQLLYIMSRVILSYTYLQLVFDKPLIITSPVI